MTGINIYRQDGQSIRHGPDRISRYPKTLFRNNIFYPPCFNACFPGSITATHIPEPTPLVVPSLQCLFSWLYYCNFGGSAVKCRTVSASMLVFLALLLQPACSRATAWRGPSFNACFPGSITATQQVQNRVCVVYELQCLFSWLYYCNGRGVCQCHAAISASMLVFLALLLQPRPLPLGEL